MIIKKTVFVMFSIILISNFYSCSKLFKPKFHKKNINLPQKFSVYKLNHNLNQKWWKEFESQELNNLIQLAFNENFDIQKGISRLNQYLILKNKENSNLYPDLQISSGFSHSKIRTDNNKNSSYKTSKNKSLGLLSSYELDLWGKLKANRKITELNALSAEQNLYYIRLSISSQIAINWINLISKQQQLSLLKKQLKNNEKYLELIDLRYRKSESTLLDLLQQKEAVAQTKSSIPMLEKNISLIENEIKILLGKTPYYKLNIESKTFPQLSDIPKTGIPADLLLNRPDIIEAGFNLEISEWQVQIAKANRLPSLNISASQSFSSDKTNLILNNWIANLSANLLAPIFDAGKRKNEVLRYKEIVKQNLLDYKHTVINALNEVENSLISEKKQITYLTALKNELKVAKENYSESFERYKKGLNNYLPVLTSLLKYQNLERNYIDALAQRYIYRCQLYQNLGGKLK